MKLDLYQIDAFTDKVFGGNPAAVCILPEWLPDDILQNIATENNLSETAFLVEDTEAYQLKWFTPKAEIDLCGHATLASGYLVLDILKLRQNKVVFDSHTAGELIVTKDNNWLMMDFPARPPEPIEAPANLKDIIKTDFVEVRASRDLFVVLESQKDVEQLEPDLNLLLDIEQLGLIVTAPASETSIDFVSRFFVPKLNIPEDPVTGSAHSNLIPYWAEKLGKKDLMAKQISQRGGTLKCAHNRNRVSIGGQAVLYLKGEITF